MGFLPLHPFNPSGPPLVHTPNSNFSQTHVPLVRETPTWPLPRGDGNNPTGPHPTTNPKLIPRCSPERLHCCMGSWGELEADSSG